MKWGFGQRELCGFVDSFSHREPRFTAAAAAPRFNGAAYWNPSANGTDDDNGKKRQGALNFGRSSSNMKTRASGHCVNKNRRTMLHFDKA